MYTVYFMSVHFSSPPTFDFRTTDNVTYIIMCARFVPISALEAKSLEFVPIRKC